MTFKYNRLKGKIVEKFNTITAFTAELGKRKGHSIAIQYVSGKLSGSVKFTIDDIVLWSEILEIQPDMIGYYFFDYELSKDERDRLK